MSSLDQAIDTQIDIARLGNDIDRVVQTAIDRGNDTDLIRMLVEIRKTMVVRGLMMAKLLYAWRENASSFGIQRDDWIDHVYAQTGLSQQTIYKYTRMWESLFANPDIKQDWLPVLATKPIEGLLLLTAAIREGQITEEDWDEIVDAPDTASIREVVRRARGKATSSDTAVLISIDRDGVIVVRRGEEIDSIGYLNREPDTELGSIGLERIINSARIRVE